MIRLVATDLDGTLLSPDGTIPDANVAALTQAHARGVRLVVATGRPTRWLHCLDPIGHLDPLVVASNGAVIYDLAAGRVVRAHAFDAAGVRAITAAIRTPLPHVRFGLERGDLFGIEPGTPSDHAFLPGVLRLPLDALIAHVTPVVKLLGYSTDASSDSLADAVTGAVGGLATVTTSMQRDDFGMVELSAPGVTKASTLAEICADLGITASDVVAFGDMPNDLDMLAWAGRGFVMSDAHASLRGRFADAGSCQYAGVGRTLLGLLDA